MNTPLLPLLLACAAGIAGGFFIPLPAPEPAAPRTRGNAPPGASQLSVSQKPAEPYLPVDPASLTAAECPDALEALLRDCHAGALTPEKQQKAIALLLRILRETAAGGDFLKSHRLPAWLIAGAWLNKPDGVPDALRAQLPSLFAGNDAARRIARALAVTDDAKAKVFADTLPLSWRPALREATLLGLATREPLRAMRSGPVSEDFQEDVAFAAAKNAPMEEAVQVMARYVDDDFYATLKPMLAMLHARDAAKTAALIANTENPKLKKWLAEVTTAATTAAEEPVPPLQRVASLTNPGTLSYQDRELAQNALAFQAVQNPAAAQTAWAAMPEGKEKDQAAVSLAGALAEHDAATALAWADKNSPRSSFEVFRASCYSDPLASLTNALRLPESNPLREQILKDLRKNPAQPRLSSFPANPETMQAILRELPPDLQKLLSPEPAIPFEGLPSPPGNNKRSSETQIIPTSP